MDADLVLIFSFILTITLISLGMGYVFTRRANEHEERKLELLARTEEAKASLGRQKTADYRQLEERVRVLERIATDGNHALAAQIEQLRDLHEIEDRTPTRETTR